MTLTRKDLLSRFVTKDILKKLIENENMLWRMRSETRALKANIALKRSQMQEIKIKTLCGFCTKGADYDLEFVGIGHGAINGVAFDVSVGICDNCMRHAQPSSYMTANVPKAIAEACRNAKLQLPRKIAARIMKGAVLIKEVICDYPKTD